MEIIELLKFERIYSGPCQFGDTLSTKNVCYRFGGRSYMILPKESWNVDDVVETVRRTDGGDLCIVMENIGDLPLKDIQRKKLMEVHNRLKEDYT